MAKKDQAVRRTLIDVSPVGRGKKMAKVYRSETRAADTATVEIHSFANALSKAKARGGKVHILLGNGFSVDCRKDIFTYTALFDRADFSKLCPHARKSFEVLRTHDFESVMKGLQTAAKLVDLYSDGQSYLTKELLRDAEGLIDVLITAITENHPDHPNEILDTEFEACRSFLCHFERIFTVNYDLLLYWTLMHESAIQKIACDDGFRMPESGPTEYVTWEVENTKQQNVYYLHGALHLFDTGPELVKFTWCNTGKRLKEQIRDALKRRMFPLVIAEGSSEDKEVKINHSGYLNRAYSSFSKIGGSLFIFGHSLSPTDNHLIKLLERKGSSIKEVFIGVFENPESDGNKTLIARAKLMKTRRPDLEVTFYKAHEANVWGHAAAPKDAPTVATKK